MIEIIPSILTSDIGELEAMLRRAEAAQVSRVQIDIVDGVFADNKTVDPSALEGVETDLKLDFHLMVDGPVGWLERCLRAGAERVIGQIEKMNSQVDFVGKATELGLSVGLAIDLATPVAALDPTILTSVDVVLVMSVPAGFGGQEFDKNVLKKISQLDEIRVRDDTPFRICDDGGITLETVDDVAKNQVDEVVIGKRLFAGNLRQNLDKFLKSAYK